MAQIAVLSTDDRLTELLRTAGFKATRVGATEMAAYETSTDIPSALVVDARRRDKLPEGVAAFRRQHPEAGVALVLSSFDPRLMLEAMRAGVTECVTEPLTPKALEDAVRRVLTNTPAQAAGQLVAFVGAKGGVGTTTLAVNTAAVVGRAARGHVLLIDLHIGQGDGAVFLGVEPRFSVIDALENIQRVDESFFAGVVEQTTAGIHLLGSSTRPIHATVEGRRIKALLDTAAQTYRVTVLDVPRSDPAMLDALDAATVIVVVTSQEIASLRNAVQMADALRHRYGASRIRIVINRFDERSAIPQADIERAVGGSVKHLIPSDYRVAVEALNAGRPLVLESDGRLAKALQALARDLVGLGKERADQPAGVFARLTWRRA